MDAEHDPNELVNDEGQAPVGFGADINQDPTLLDHAKEEAKSRLQEKAKEKIVDPIRAKLQQRGAAQTAGKVAGQATEKIAEKAATQTAVNTGAQVATKAAVQTTAKVATGAVAEAAAGPAGWVVLAAQIAAAALTSKTGKKIILWTGIVLISIALFTIVLVLAMFQAKNHFGPDLTGGIKPVPVNDTSIPALASANKGKLVVTNLDTIDQSIAAAEGILKANPTIANASRIRELLTKIKDMRRDTESKAYSSNEEQAGQLKQYRQILEDLALAIDPDAASKQTALLDRINRSEGIIASQTRACAPVRDLENLAVTGSLIKAVNDVADVAKANNLTAQLRCLVTGYRDLVGGNNEDHPMCGTIDSETAKITDGHKKNIATHCHGRGADFGGDFEALFTALEPKAATLGITLTKTEDHLHIEVQP